MKRLAVASGLVLLGGAFAWISMDWHTTPHHERPNARLVRLSDGLRDSR
jgi:hypothetical protein